MRSLLRASMKAIASLYNYRLSANSSSNQIPKTIDHVIPKVSYKGLSDYVDSLILSDEQRYKAIVYEQA